MSQEQEELPKLFKYNQADFAKLLASYKKITNQQGSYLNKLNIDITYAEINDLLAKSLVPIKLHYFFLNYIKYEDNQRGLIAKGLYLFSISINLDEENDEISFSQFNDMNKLLLDQKYDKTKHNYIGITIYFQKKYSFILINVNKKTGIAAYDNSVENIFQDISDIMSEIFENQFQLKFEEFKMQIINLTYQSDMNLIVLFYIYKYTLGCDIDKLIINHQEVPTLNNQFAWLILKIKSLNQQTNPQTKETQTIEQPPPKPQEQPAVKKPVTKDMATVTEKISTKENQTMTQQVEKKEFSGQTTLLAKDIQLENNQDNNKKPDQIQQPPPQQQQIQQPIPKKVETQAKQIQTDPVQEKQAPPPQKPVEKKLKDSQSQTNQVALTQAICQTDIIQAPIQQAPAQKNIPPPIIQKQLTSAMTQTEKSKAELELEKIKQQKDLRIRDHQTQTDITGEVVPENAQQLNDQNNQKLQQSYFSPQKPINQLVNISNNQVLHKLNSQGDIQSPTKYKKLSLNYLKETLAHTLKKKEKITVEKEVQTDDIDLSISLSPLRKGHKNTKLLDSQMTKPKTSKTQSQRSQGEYQLSADDEEIAQIEQKSSRGNSQGSNKDDTSSQIKQLKTEENEINMISEINRSYNKINVSQVKSKKTEFMGKRRVMSQYEFEYDISNQKKMNLVAQLKLQSPRKLMPINDKSEIMLSRPDIIITVKEIQNIDNQSQLSQNIVNLALKMIERFFNLQWASKVFIFSTKFYNQLLMKKISYDQVKKIFGDNKMFKNYTHLLVPAFSYFTNSYYLGAFSFNEKKFVQHYFGKNVFADNNDLIFNNLVLMLESERDQTYIKENDFVKEEQKELASKQQISNTALHLLCQTLKYINSTSSFLDKSESEMKNEIKQLVLRQINLKNDKYDFNNFPFF